MFTVKDATVASCTTMIYTQSLPTTNPQSSHKYTFITHTIQHNTHTPILIRCKSVPQKVPMYKNAQICNYM